MYDIFAYIWLMFMGNVGKYTSPMDHMGINMRWLLLGTLLGRSSGFSSGGKKSHEDRAASVPNGLNGTYMWVTSYILHNS